MENDWHLKVYNSKNNKDYGKSEWAALKVFIFIKQKNKCAMCKNIFSDKHLTLHHVIPRSKGGKDKIYNLIGLCNNCHDIAELKELKRNEIIHYYDKNKIIHKEKANKNDWHMWVYGGYSRPSIKKEYPRNNDNYNNEDISLVGYSYPEHILLREKYIIKTYLTKYTLKYGYTLKDMAKILRMHPSTVYYWLTDPIKKEKIVRIINNFK